MLENCLDYYNEVKFLSRTPCGLVKIKKDNYSGSHAIVRDREGRRYPHPAGLHRRVLLSRTLRDVASSYYSI